MDLNNEKRRAFEAAQKNLSSQEDDSLRYAALDLRNCIEAIVYQKLWARKDWLPAEIVRTWQPPQAFAALLAIEPDVEESATLAIAPERTPGEMPPRDSFRTLGVEYRPRVRWLKKTYNKLGNFIHARSPFTEPTQRNSSSQAIRAYLETTIHELERYVQNDLTFAIANVVHYECSWCSFKITLDVGALKEGRKVTCLRCNGGFSIAKHGNDFTLIADTADVLCHECKETIVVPVHELASGHRFSCNACGCQYHVTGQAWQFCKVSNIDNAGSDEKDDKNTAVGSTGADEADGSEDGGR